MNDGPDNFDDVFSAELVRRLARDCVTALDQIADEHQDMRLDVRWHDGSGAAYIFARPFPTKVDDAEEPVCVVRPGTPFSQIVRDVERHLTRLNPEPDRN